MLVYVATYPRCGSGVLRWLIGMNFGLGTDPLWDEEGGDRAGMAASDAVHLVKTHERPPADPLPGERAIQMIRHPGAATASQYRLYLATKPRERPLKRFIIGHAQSGLNWSSFYEAWAESSMPKLLFRYEEAYADPLPIVPQIAAFLGIRCPVQPVAERPEQASERNPTRNPGAGLEGWRQVIKGKDLGRLTEAHGETARRFGYRFDRPSEAGGEGPQLSYPGAA